MTKTKPSRQAGPRLADLLFVATGIPVIAAVIYAITRAYLTYHPPRAPVRKTPEDFGLTALAVSIPTMNPRISLNAWQFFQNPGGPAVVIGHGLGQTKEFALPYAAFLYNAGYNVLAFDHRNHGNSDPDRVPWKKSNRFTDDVHAAVNYVRAQRGYAESAVALLTFSFSTFPALYVLKRPDCRVDAIVCDSGPALDLDVLPERFMDVGKAMIPSLLRRPILFTITKKVYRWTINTMLGAQWPPDLSAYKGKMLLISNEADIVIPPDEVVAMANLYPGSEHWVAPATGHLMALRRRGQEYSALVLDFLGRALEKTGRKDEPRLPEYLPQ